MRYMFLTSAPNRDRPAAAHDRRDRKADRTRNGRRPHARAAAWPADGDGRRAHRIAPRQAQLTDGPFAETKEVLGGFAIFEFATREEAIAAPESFMELHRKHWPEWEGVCEMRPMFGFGATAAATVDA